MDIFIDLPEIDAHSIESSIDRHGYWCIEHFSGPSTALNRVEKKVENGESLVEPITTEPCAADSYHKVLERTEKKCIVYSHVSNITTCETVHTLVARHINPGIVMERTREEKRQEWRLLLKSDENVGILYDVLGARMDSRLEFEMRAIQEASGWSEELLGIVSMPGEQRAVLHAAVDSGYYETPRETTLDDLAEQLEIPRSTVSYRLRRAEATLAHAFTDL